MQKIPVPIKIVLPTAFPMSPPQVTLSFPTIPGLNLQSHDYLMANQLRIPYLNTWNMASNPPPNLVILNDSNNNRTIWWSIYWIPLRLNIHTILLVQCHPCKSSTSDIKNSAPSPQPSAYQYGSPYGQQYPPPTGYSYGGYQMGGYQQANPLYGPMMARPGPSPAPAPIPVAPDPAKEKAKALEDIKKICNILPPLKIQFL